MSYIINPWEPDWECSCGHGDSHDPFHTVNFKREEVEPIGEHWFYQCTGCEQMYYESGLQYKPTSLADRHHQTAVTLLNQVALGKTYTPWHDTWARAATAHALLAIRLELMKGEPA